MLNYSIAESKKKVNYEIVNIATSVLAVAFVPLLIGFETSLAIELIQLVISRGICDVDDLFANTLGAVIGFWLIMALLSLFREKGERVRPCLLYSALSLFPVLAICAVFIAYHFQEYGNFANAPAYINHTKGFSWKLQTVLMITVL